MKKNLIVYFLFFFTLHIYAQQPKMVIPTGHSGSILSIDISPNGKLVATGGDDNIIILWDTKTWKQLRTIFLPFQAKEIHFLPDSRHIAVGAGNLVSTRLSFSIWSTNGELVQAFPYEGNEKFSVTNSKIAVTFFSESISIPSTQNIIKTLLNPNLALIDLNTKKVSMVPAVLPQAASFISRNGVDYLLSSGMALGGDSNVELWDCKDIEQGNAKPVKTFLAKGEIKEFIIAPTGNYFATVKGRQIALWNLDSTTAARQIRTNGYVEKISFSKDGQSLWFCTKVKDNYYINKLNIADSTKSFMHELSLPEEAAEITFSPDYDYIIHSSRNNVFVMDLNGNLLAGLTGRISRFNSYVFSDNNRFVETTIGISDGRGGEDRLTAPQMLNHMNEAMLKVMEQQKNVKYSDNEKDSLLNVLKLGQSKSSPVVNARFWDLQYGNATNTRPNSIAFTNDSISPNRQFKIAATYKSTGIVLVPRFLSELNIKDHALFDSSHAGKTLKKMFTNPASSMNRQPSEILSLINTKTSDTVYLIALDSTGWIITSNEGYYMASKNTASALHYVINDNVLSFEQLDLKNNRPDKILQKIGYANNALIDVYKKAYEKRIEKSGIDTSYFNNPMTLPEAFVTNKNDISFVQHSDSLKLQIKASDKKSKLKRFNVWVNRVPVFSSIGVDLSRRNKNTFDTSIVITLSEGDNRIETSVINASGVESFRTPLFVKHVPAQPKKKNIYFVGIGIDRFADSSRNLRFCRKDIRDLCLGLQLRLSGSLNIDTLFDEKVTLENVKNLKNKLLLSKEDDEVIIAYSGHGLLNKSFDYFLSTYDVNFADAGVRGLPYTELEGLVDGIRARKKLMLIDACHSGELDKSEIAGLKLQQKQLEKKLNITVSVDRGGIMGVLPISTMGAGNTFELMQQLFVYTGRSTGTAIIAAASGMQFAIERSDLQNGVFTFSILELLQNNSTIKLSILKEKVNERVFALTGGLQMPAFRAETTSVDWNVW